MSTSNPATKSGADVDALVRDLVEGRRRFHELPDTLSAEDAARIRRRALEKKLAVRLRRTGSFTLDAARAASRHCENFIGATQVPVGVAGPLKIQGQWVSEDEEIFVPLATTEGALVASINRGCQALREAGGAIVRVEDVGMTRAPVFKTSGIDESQRFLAWVREHEEDIRRVTEGTSRHLRLLEVRPQVLGTTIYLRFRFDSGDAMGMNMVTVACDRVVRTLIEPQTGVSCVALSGNFCVDKKASAVNFLEGRGKRVYAEVTLEGPVLKRCLRTGARDLVDVQYRKNLLGSIAAGAMGFNAHFANTLAAFFIATGQDVAHVVEGSMGGTCVEPRGPEGVFASVFLPDLPLGAVGGGTALDTQKEALAMLGISLPAERPGGAVMRLAEIVGATVLAAELSLLAAFTSGDLASAHERLGRGPVAEES
jgi:hydroxymethylglutaryl-CoA reductase (NADPH)